MLQRIYGTAWESEEQLKAYLHFKEEAKRRDHRLIGQDLDLFSVQVLSLETDASYFVIAIDNSNFFFPSFMCIPILW